MHHLLTAPLGTAVVGDQFWFIFAERSDGGPPIMICPLDDSPSMPNLIALVRSSGLTAGTQIVQGKARIGLDGAVEFEGPGVHAGMFAALSGYVVAHAAEDPELERLAGARFVQVGRGPTSPVLATFADDAAWGGMHRPPLPGTMAETVMRLMLMEPGQRAWFWLTAEGPQGLPFLLVSLVEEDPDGLLLQQEVQALKGDGRIADAVVGTMLRTDSLFTFTASTPATGWSALIQDLLDTWAEEEPALLGLAAAPLTYVRDGTVVGFEAADCVLPDSADNLLGEVRALINASAGGWFWFTDDDGSGRARLLLAADADELAARSGTLSPAGATAHGTLSADGDTLTLSTDSDADSLAAGVGAWIAEHAPAWPILGRLHGATVRGAAGEQRSL